MTSLAFIVSAFENSLELTCCLASLKLQAKNNEMSIAIHVADNSVEHAAYVQQACALFEGVVYHKTSGGCYKAAEQVNREIRADWLCFASSDSYYVPGFAQIMLETAIRCKSDLVYCDCLYDPRLHGRGVYSVLNVFPEMRWIDKTCFIVRRELFKGFPKHEQDWRDGALVEQFVSKGYRLAKAKGILVVHN